MGPWPGPPGCTCDLTRRAPDRCTKGGWLRCQGALNAMMSQYKYRERFGPKGGKASEGSGIDPLGLRGRRVTLKIKHGKLRVGDVCTVIGSCLGGGCGHRSEKGKFIHVRRDDGAELNHLTLDVDAILA